MVTIRQDDWVTKTKEQIKNPNIPQNGPNWLDHNQGTQAFRIDEILLKGATVEEIAKDLIERGLSERDINIAIKRVKKHIYHLKTSPGTEEKGHGLDSLLKEDFGVWKFVIDNIQNEYENNSLNNPSINGEIPTKEEVAMIYRRIARMGQEINGNLLKSSIEEYFVDNGRTLHKDWWEYNKKNMEEWSKKG